MQDSLDLAGLRGKRVLITGGLGFIGSNVVHLCLEHGAEVTVFDCLDPRSGGNLKNVADIKDHIRICFHDILNFDQLTEQIVDKDIVFNCAASTSHSFSMREPWLDQDVNSRGMINLLEALRRFNDEAKLVHLGTTTQLGKLHFQPADELHPEFPTDIYSANKSVSEKYALVYANAYGLRLFVLRLSNCFGPRGSILDPSFTFNNYFIGLALQGKTITVFGDGKQRRNVLYVEDAVLAMCKAALCNQRNGETYFAVSDHHYSVAEIAETTVRHLGGKVAYVDWPAGRKQIDVGDAVYSNAKIKKALGWQPLDDLESGMVKTREFYNKHLKDYLR